jgi:hypothetical protein
VNAEIVGGKNVGGAVGTSFADLHDVTVSGSVEGTENVGGIVGLLDHYQRWDGQNLAGHIHDSRSSASVVGDSKVGTLVGYKNQNAEVVNSHSLDVRGDEYGNQDEVDIWEREVSKYPDILNNTAGDGSEVNPHILTNISELQAMQADLDAHFQLSGHINASETRSWNEVNGEYQGFSPVGDYQRPFKGELNGDGNVISGLYINQSLEVEERRRSQPTVGIFGYTSDATIENIQIRNASVSGYYDAGVLVGDSEDSKIRNVSVHGDVMSLLIDGRIQSNYVAGGLLGRMDGGSVRAIEAESQRDRWQFRRRHRWSFI